MNRSAAGGHTGFILHGARLFDREQPVDLAVKDGVFVPVRDHSDLPVLDLEGCLVIPGFVDLHMHLDKAFALDGGLQPGDSLGAAIHNFYRWRETVTPELIYRSARQTAERALIHGTLALRTHTTIDSQVGLSWLETSARIKEELAPRLKIQIVAFPDTNELLSGKADPLIKAAITAGADAIGGAPLMCTTPERAVDILLEMAGEAGCDLDLHIDESDDPKANTLEYLAERKVALGFPNRVTAGHCTSLSAMSDMDACRVIEKVALAGLHIVTLPSCNLFLMGRKDRGLVRRGLTRVHELLAAGVRVSFASDNVRDAFNPFGNADMLQQALITAHALHLGTADELSLLLKMGTQFPAEAMGMAWSRLQVGDEASFIVLDAPDWGSALAQITPARSIYVRGQCVARTSIETQLHTDYA